MTEIVEREMLERRIEYRRKILSHVLSEDTTVNIASIRKTWAVFVAKYDVLIRNNQKILADLKKLKNGEMVPEDSDAHVFHKYYLNRHREGDYIPFLEEKIGLCEKKLKTCIFIRRLLGQEKNWVERVLES